MSSAHNPNSPDLLITSLESGDFPTAISILEDKHRRAEMVEYPDKYTPLHHASQHGRIDILKQLITKFNHNIEDKDKHGCTPLHTATKYGNLETVRYILHLLLAKENSKLHLTTKTSLSDFLKKVFREILNQCKDNKGNTPLHYAVKYGKLPIVKYFIEEFNCDPSCKGQSDNSSLILIVSESGSLEVVEYLTTKYEFDIVNHKNSDNKTPLHIAAINGNLAVLRHYIEIMNCDPECRGGRNKGTPLHQACKNGHLDIVKYLITSCKCSPSCINEKHNTPLHCASSNDCLEIVEYLTTQCDCSPLCKNAVDGMTPLHFAAESGLLMIVEYFITSMKCDPNIQDNHKNTPLHYACKKGYDGIAEYLLKHGNCDPTICNKYKRTPLHEASKQGHLDACKSVMKYYTLDLNIKDADKNSVIDYAAYYSSLTDYFRQLIKREEEIAPKIFVVGFSESGKTTLVSALQREQDLQLFRTSIFDVPRVVPHTIGVIPSNYASSHYGKVLLYDFAGHEEYHANHELLFRSTLHPVALITVDLTRPVTDLIRQVKYWTNILLNSIQSTNTTASVIVIGSHYDKIKSSSDVTKEFTRCLKDLFCGSTCEAIRYFDLITLDCRKSHSPGMKQLRKLLKPSCLAARNEISSLNYAKDLDHFITNNFICKFPACSMELLCERARALGFIPNKAKSEEQLFQMCEGLSHYGKLLFLKNNSSSWLIFDEDSIFSFALTKLEKTSPYECGLLSLSQIKEISADSQLDIDIIIDYLLYAQICTEVRSESFSATPSIISADKCYFFPSLIRSVKPDNIPLLSQDTTPFYGWCLVCKDLMTPRFLQVLFIQLTVPLTGAGDIVCPKYTTWKNGMYIANNDTTETYIEVRNSSSQVMLAIRCKVGNESWLTRRRSHLISLILSTLTKNCPSVEFTEYVLKPQDSYPTNECTKIAIRDVAGGVMENKPSTTTQGEDDSIITRYDSSNLLNFEPLRLLDTETLKCFFLHPDNTVPHAIIKQLHKKLEQKYSNFNLLPTAKTSTRIKYNELHQMLSQHSIFIGRNLWELAGVPLEPNEVSCISSSRQESVLSMEDQFQVTQSLKNLNNEQLIEVGLGLGLLYPHLKRMSNSLHDMVAAWLNEEDSVSEKSGPPSWTSLMRVLEEVGQKGIATKIKEQLNETYLEKDDTKQSAEGTDIDQDHTT